MAAPTSKPFAKLDGDTGDYSPAPGGSFEASDAAWTLSGGAKVTTGNEQVGVAAGKRSLRLPVGGVATSPEFCVDETKPHFRFAYKIDSIGYTGFVAFVQYKNATGATTATQFLSSQQLSIPPSKWQLTPASPLATVLPLNGGTGTVRIKLIGVTALGNVSLATAYASIYAAAASPVANLGVSIDSVMIDPLRRA